MALLHILSGDRAGEEVSLERLKTTFGRGHSVDCILNHPTVSREHFFIERTNGKFIAVDQNSNNGTFVNGERISWKELKRGDRVQAGPFLFEV
jgi:pSer/pThr/pTyr-binding forkhead associated (FHA) protein